MFVRVTAELTYEVEDDIIARDLIRTQDLLDEVEDDVLHTLKNYTYDDHVFITGTVTARQVIGSVRRPLEN